MNKEKLFSYEKIAKNLLAVGENILIRKDYIKEVKKQIDFDKLIQFMCLEKISNYNLEQENTRLKQVLNEIRKYITKTIVYEDLGDGYSYNCDEYNEGKFLQIIDKVLGGDNY